MEKVGHVSVASKGRWKGERQDGGLACERGRLGTMEKASHRRRMARKRRRRGEAVWWT